MSRKIDRIRSAAIANLKASPTKSAVLGIVFLVLVVMVVRQMSGGPSSVSADPGLADMMMPGVDMPDSSNEEPRCKPRPILAKSLARDPFSCMWISRPVKSWTDDSEESNGDTKNELVLQCTMQGRAGLPALAVISGVVVYSGSKLDKYEVLSIGPRHAVLRNGNEELVLKMR